MNKEEQKQKKKLDALDIKIEKSNKEFQKLSIMERRIAVAKDVLKSINAKTGTKMIPKTGCYLFLRDHTGDRVDVSNSTDPKDFQRLLLDETVDKCTVCALGSILVSAVKLGDSIRYTVGNTVSVNHLAPLAYTEEELNELEIAFEGRMENLIRGDDSLNAYSSSIKFYDYYGDSKDRLKAIMRNIIRNKGIFIPSNLPRNKKKEQLDA